MSLWGPLTVHVKVVSVYIFLKGDSRFHTILLRLGHPSFIFLNYNLFPHRHGNKSESGVAECRYVFDRRCSASEHVSIRWRDHFKEHVDRSLFPSSAVIYQDASLNRATPLNFVLHG